MLFDAHELRLDRDLIEIARLLNDIGWSRFVMQCDGGVSLPAAVGLICGARHSHLSENFDVMLAEIPEGTALRFCAIWDLLESASGMDLVDLNEDWELASQPQAFLRNVADLVEIG